MEKKDFPIAIHFILKERKRKGKRVEEVRENLDETHKTKAPFVNKHTALVIKLASYVPNRGEIRYAHIPSNIQCHTTQWRACRNIKKNRPRNAIYPTAHIDN